MIFIMSSIFPIACPLSRRCWENLDLLLLYLKYHMCSWNLILNGLPVCPVYVILQSGQVNRYTPLLSYIHQVLWTMVRRLPEGSSPQSKVPFTCPFPDPDLSSPSSHIPLPENPSQYYSNIYDWLVQVVTFCQFSRPKTFLNLSSGRYVLHATFISFFSV